MSGVPSILEILTACKYVWDKSLEFRNAPEQIKKYQAECQAFYHLLRQVEQQSRNKLSPYHLLYDGDNFMKGCLSTCADTLRGVQEKLAEYERMGVIDRAGFVTTDFDTPMQELRNHRNIISTQLSIGHDRVLELLLNKAFQLAEDVRRGRRSSVIDDETIVSGGTVSQAFIAEELRGSDLFILDDDYERCRPTVECYVLALSEAGGFQDPLQRSSREIGPDDSVSTYPENPKSYRQDSKIPDREWPKHRGLPVENITYGTIFNPYADLRPTPIPKPDTFDIWGLAKDYLRLQILCAEKLDNESQYETDMSSIRTISDRLAECASMLLLCLAKSSTDTEFWSHLDQRGTAVIVGRDFSKSLKELARLVEKLRPSPKKRFSFKKVIWRERDTGREIDKCVYNRGWPDCNDLFFRLHPSPPPWHMTREIFTAEINKINEQWCLAYEAARRTRTGATEAPSKEDADGGQILMQWLLGAQGMDLQQGSTGPWLDTLLSHLAFHSSPPTQRSYLI